MFDPSYLFPMLFLSMLGMGLFMHAKKAANIVTGVAGILLMIEPYVFSAPWALWAVGLGTVAAMCVVLKLGAQG